MFAKHLGRQVVTCEGVGAPRSWSVISKCAADFTRPVRCLTGRGTPCCLGGDLPGWPMANRVGSDASVVNVLSVSAVSRVWPTKIKRITGSWLPWLQMFVPASTKR